MSEMASKLLRWLVFGVIISLLPIAVSFLEFVAKDKTPTMRQVMGDGGLLLIISAVCAGSLGEIIGSGQRALAAKIISAGGAVVVLIISSLLFAAILEGKGASTYDESIVASISMWVFALGLLPCAACIALSEF
jgi:hypothetical protein